MVAAREKAEAAKRRSEEMLTKELSLKKEGPLSTPLISPDLPQMLAKELSLKKEGADLP